MPFAWAARPSKAASSVSMTASIKPTNGTHARRDVFATGCHAAASEPTDKAVLLETQATEVFSSRSDSHLVRRRLNDLRGLSVANMASVRLAVATVTDDADPARPGEVDASLYRATSTTQHDGSHFSDLRNERAMSPRQKGNPVEA